MIAKKLPHTHLLSIRNLLCEPKICEADVPLVIQQQVFGLQVSNNSVIKNAVGHCCLALACLYTKCMSCRYLPPANNEATCNMCRFEELRCTGSTHVSARQISAAYMNIVLR